MKLYIFNPDTDLALANNRENYMPPARVKQMTKELGTPRIAVAYLPPRRTTMQNL